MQQVANEPTRHVEREAAASKEDHDASQRIRRDRHDHKQTKGEREHHRQVRILTRERFVHHQLHIERHRQQTDLNGE